jgi:hypothetical protein
MNGTLIAYARADHIKRAAFREAEMQDDLMRWRSFTNDSLIKMARPMGNRAALAVKKQDG